MTPAQLIAHRFRQRQQRQLGISLLAIPAVIVVIGGWQGWWSGPVAFGLAFANLGLILGVTLAVWRCPACDRYLGGSWKLHACPLCETSFTGTARPPTPLPKGPAPRAGRVRCPDCKCLTDSLKTYRLWTSMWFLVLFFQMGMELVTACPSCMRRKLGRYAIRDLLPGNVIWLLVGLPYSAAAALMSRRRGHSRNIVVLLREDPGRLLN
ncbi:MAG: hypothetical protein GY898_34360 [Proteobacteria bacterium]|nr:hypothetical protein [Pseudomonadota bacterium]